MPEPFVVMPRPVSGPASGESPLPAPAPRERRAARVTAAPRPAVLQPLAPFLDEPDVTDLFINGSSGLYVDRGSGPVEVAEWCAAEDEVRDLAVALIALGGRHIDDATPCVDVRLEDGMRVHAVLPPVSASGTTVSIRIPMADAPTLEQLQERGMLDPAQRRRIDEIVAARRNILITGAAGAGKTTLLAAMLGLATAAERIVTIEDVAELRIRHPHHVRLEARQSNLEGIGAIGLARLVREALRMRPDRLVVGECRGDEVRELLSALNTGHDGGAGTLHANSLRDVPARLEALGALAGMPDLALARQVASAIHVVLHLERGRDGVRRLAGIGVPAIDAAGRLRIDIEGES
ncbi:TadA family conjugal transfer-associated ATPase [Microbacterium rhizomatis]|uniref:TadA family conjugal transfer-associated ATPase n=1 Tax=Microbacterium rhizomatis TaxID=1631477 RepID=A0A5J5IYX8_9MICO|nr:TadA family conjugal transfer-associated ATPase [Microbacterium rhizomatis]KAA9107571.1 TadA family conjugal transfer-associated ATPase [Microbacterium rhizomatis]